jgi:spermidine synthase
MSLFFVFFFLSGFCGLVYQVVWLRVAMSAFGVTTALVSIVLSVFMAGLALGSWVGGRIADRLRGQRPAFFVRLYGAAELVIGISGLAVIPLLTAGHHLLAGRAGWGSPSYHLASGGWIALVMLPFCTAMGATFPLAMAGLRERMSFSFLYVANVLGAMAGTLLSAFVFIELLGFRRTALLSAALNGCIAAGAFALAPRRPVKPAREDPPPATAKTAPPDPLALPLLFASGLGSLGMEVVWTRQFVPFLGPVVYAFGIMLAVYLAATAGGSRIYRALARQRSFRPGSAAVLAGCCALLPLFAADPRFAWQHRLAVGALRVACGVGAFCAVLGFLTPMLVDRWSSGDPNRAGRAYAINGAGCVIGPLLAGFVLLPGVGERWTLIILSLPFFAFGLAGRASPRLTVAAVIGSLVLIGFTRDFETLYPGAIVRRDHTATVIAAGTGMHKRLLVNGMGITSLTPITKMMVHFPLAELDRPPHRVLVLCFGMGTSFRSALAWGAGVTSVDLVPSVPPLMPFFHADGGALLRSPRARIVIDDARRFLERTRDTFDAIVIDPPPPAEAAGSSLLYSAEFYRLAAKRLRLGGILQQWLPQAERIVVSSAARAVEHSFSHVRVFRSIEGWGLHFFASETEIARQSAPELAAHMPAPAARDLVEWGPASTPDAQFEALLSREVPFESVVALDPSAPILTDDRAVNEYYFLRRMGRGAARFK